MCIHVCDVFTFMLMFDLYLYICMLCKFFKWFLNISNEKVTHYTVLILNLSLVEKVLFYSIFSM